MRALIVSINAFSLLSGEAYLRQSGLKPDRVAVVHYESPAHLVELERWLCGVLGREHVGDLGLLWQRSEKMLAGPWWTRPLRLRRFLPRWRAWAATHLPELDAPGVEHVIMPYRPHAADLLLANLFPRARFHFVSEGMLIGFTPLRRLPLKYAAAGLRFPYRKRGETIWSLPVLEKAMHGFGRPRLIEQRHFDAVVEQVTAHPDFREFIARVFGMAITDDFSCLLLQPLAHVGEGRGVDLPSEIAAWAAIIRRELQVSPETIIVKPHPRDTELKLDLIRRLLPEEWLTRVRFLGTDTMSKLPLELYFRFLPIRRLVGICSTALLLAPAAGVELRAYRAAELLSPMEKEISRGAVAGGYQPVELAASLTG